MSRPPRLRITRGLRTAPQGSRIELEPRDDESRELADSSAPALAEREALAAEQQRFAANASHELRTPLAITKTLLEVARNDPQYKDGELIERLASVNERAIAITEALLLLSRASQRSFVRDVVDLSLICEDVAERLLPLAEARAITVQLSGDSVNVRGSSALLEEMVTHLVHNAVVHNLTSDGVVWISCFGLADAAVLRVENTGGALAPDVAPTLSEPFQRGSGRVTTGHAGGGLGLAIVKSIVGTHNGVLEVSPRDEGGLRVSVQLPVATA